MEVTEINCYTVGTPTIPLHLLGPHRPSKFCDHRKQIRTRGKAILCVLQFHPISMSQNMLGRERCKLNIEKEHGGKKGKRRKKNTSNPKKHVVHVHNINPISFHHTSMVNISRSYPVKNRNMVTTHILTVLRLYVYIYIFMHHMRRISCESCSTIILVMHFICVPMKFKLHE